MFLKEGRLRRLWLQSRAQHTSLLPFNTMQTTITIWGGEKKTRKDINSASVVEEERWSRLEGPGGGDEVRRPIDVLYIVMNVGTVWGGGARRGRKMQMVEGRQEMASADN